MNTTFSLRNRIREVRKRLRLRQSDLAEETGVTRQTIIAIEKSRLNPSVALSLRIARILREPVEYLFYLEPGRKDEQILDEMDAGDSGTIEPVDVQVPDAVAAEVAEEADDAPCSPLDEALAVDAADAPAAFEETPRPPAEPEPVSLDGTEPVSPEGARNELEWLAEMPPEQAPVVSEDEGTGQAIWDFV